MEEIVTLNGSLFKIWYETPLDRMKAIRSLQANLAQNPGFETVDPTNAYQPANWWSDYDPAAGPIADFPYNGVGDLPGRSGKGAAIIATTSGDNYWAQEFLSISPSAAYTLTVYASTTNVVGTGVYAGIDWFDSAGNWIGGDESTSLLGTNSWTQLTVTNTSPSNAVSGNIVLGIRGTGTVVFDDVTFIGGGGGGGNNYGCSNGQCLAGYGTLPPGCNNTCGGGGGNNYGCSNGQCLAGYGTLPPGCNNTCGGGGGGGTTCDPATCPPDKNYCVGGTCVPKNYVMYGGIAFGALFLLSILKR